MNDPLEKYEPPQKKTVGQVDRDIDDRFSEREKTLTLKTSCLSQLKDASLFQ